MKKREKVSGIMTTGLHTVDVNDSLKEVKEIFGKHKIKHLPVLASGELVGIISLTDILRISFGNTFGEGQEDADEAIFDMLSINQVMKHSPTVVDVNDTIVEAAQILADKEFHALPVVDKEKLAGIVTTTDIIRYFIDQS